MKTSFLEIRDEPSEKEIIKSGKIGFVCQLMAESRMHVRRPMHYILEIIKPAIAHNQIKIYFNRRGEPVGYLIWAFLAPDVEKKVISGEQLAFHISEWNEGPMPWIVDFVALRGHLNEMLKDIRDVVFKNEETVRYFRLREARRIVKEISRDGKGSFMKPRR